jgi:PBSX family phage terminase large subunit
MDTNPENPQHFVKTEIIDKGITYLSSGQMNTISFHFTLFDNTFLDKDYVETIIANTPTGVYTDRDIYGLWVNAEGLIYKDFKEEIHILPNDKVEEFDFEYYVGGVDWGWQHYGSVVVFGVTHDDTYVLLEEIAEQEQHFDWWAEVLLDLQNKYGDILFWADHARPDAIDFMIERDIAIRNADKSVLDGINAVSTLLAKGKLLFSENLKLGRIEFANYSWDPKANQDKPIKKYDDVLNRNYLVHRLIK